MPHKVKPGTRIQSYLAGKPYNISPWATTYRMEARASEEVGSLSAPRAAPSGPNRVTLRACIRSDRSRQLFVKSSNRIKRRGHDNRDVIAPRWLKHQNARDSPVRSYNKPNSKKSPLGACKPAEDVGLAEINPKPSERSIHASCNHSKH